MTHSGLRDFLDLLERKGDLHRVEKQIEGGYEAASIVWELNNRDGEAVVFENVKGYRVPLVKNVLGSFRRVALALGLDEGTSIKEMRNYMAEGMEDQGKWIAPRIVQDGPCKEVVLKGENASLASLPILKWHPGDAGPYITLGAVITNDPEWGQNMGIYRMQLYDAKTTGILLPAMQDIGIYAAKERRRGSNRLKAAVAIGLDPVLYLTACAKMPIPGHDAEFRYAGLLRGEPVDLVKCETCDIYVPASAEVVIEGEILLDEKRIEGPYGEFMGYYEEEMVMPVFRVSCVTHREKPLYQSCTTGHRYSETEIMRHVPIQCNSYNILKKVVPGFRDYYVPSAGRGYEAVVQIKKRHPGWGRTALLTVLGTGQPSASVNIVVSVDEDIDIYDQEDVDFAIATRADPARDVIILPPIGTYPLNPAASARADSMETGFTEYAMASKMGIDATMKTELEGRRRTPAVVRPDPETYGMVRQQWKLYGFR